MNLETQYRYPGLEPFNPDQKELFFGRSADVEWLAELVDTHQQVLLYAKSGLGKSSLLNAGLIPRLQATASAHIMPIRIGTYVDANSSSPLEAVHRALPTVQETFLDRIIPQENSLWYHFKADSLVAATPKVYYLIFDQFEELFSHPEASIFAFKKQLAGLLYRAVPLHFKSVLEIRQRQNQGLLSRAEFELLHQEMEIRVVYAIREDRYSELNRLADYLPDLQHHKYQLGPLSRVQAEEAVVRPALLEGNYQHLPFQYSPQAVQRILDYLTSGQQPIVETTQLQILCSHIERLGKAFITVDDIPEFDNIFLQFYDESIDCLPPQDQVAVRTFIESKLILNGQRIAYHRLVCLESISEQSLDLLLRERHLLRTERSSTGGISYELSHDTLIAPILLAKKRREVEEGRRAREAARFAAEMEQAAEATRLREDLAKTRLGRLKTRRLLRYATAGLVAAVFGIAVAVIAMIVALHNEKEAERQTKIAEKATMEAEVARDLEREARLEADSLQCYAELMRQRLVDKVVQGLWDNAFIYRSMHEDRTALGLLDSALVLDSTRVEIKALIKRWRLRK